jgi:hypothetical protein
VHKQLSLLWGIAAPIALLGVVFLTLGGRRVSGPEMGSMLAGLCSAQLRVAHMPGRSIVRLELLVPATPPEPRGFEGVE